MDTSNILILSQFGVSINSGKIIWFELPSALLSLKTNQQKKETEVYEATTTRNARNSGF
jgi:hypothetical protein